MTGSNRRPPACKAGALPAELIPRESHCRIYLGLQHLVGLVGFEPTTPALSTQCSNQLSYRPKPAPTVSYDFTYAHCSDFFQQPISVGVQIRLRFSRKEVIQPHLPIRLPCYDFTPVTNPAVVIALLAVRLTTSGETRSHGVTGGVYKTRERIHRDILIHDY